MLDIKLASRAVPLGKVAARRWAAVVVQNFSASSKIWKGPMIQQFALSSRIAIWTREAVEIWGDDWPRISAYIEQRMTSLDPGEQRDLAREAALTLVNADVEAKH